MIYNTYERFFFTPFFFKTYNFEFPFDTLDFKTRDLSGGEGKEAKWSKFQEIDLLKITSPPPPPPPL